jgi:hypothetical protein
MKYVVLAMLALLMAGCGSGSSDGGGDPDYPDGATHVRSEGNGWWSFQWKGSCFLMQKNGVSWGNSFDRAFTSYTCPLTPEP